MRFLTNSNGDFDLTGGKGSVVESVEQRVRQRLRRIKGEWFLNINEGVPYFEVLGEKAGLDKFILSLKKEITLTKNLAELVEFNQGYESNSRKLTISFRARTSAGAIISISETF